ncbi:hypothetical protein JCM10207_007148 [Rhodosporidiobolus poonsookiae]
MSSPPLAFPSTESSDSPAPTPPKPPRRPYATHSSREFSRSALARQSVTALPSIKHLQHNFARLGLQGQSQAAGAGQPRSVAEMVGGLSADEVREARRKSSALRRSLAWAEGTLAEEDEGEHEGAEAWDLGPEPEKPQVDARLPWEKDDAGPAVMGERALRDEVLEVLESVCDRWGLIAHLTPSHPSRRLSRSSYSASSSASPVPSRAASPAQFLSSLSPSLPERPYSPLLGSDTDAASTASSSTAEPPLVLDLLTSTTAAVRAVQRYVVALPASAFAPPPSPSAVGAPLGDATNRPAQELPHLLLSTSSRPRPRSSLAGETAQKDAAPAEEADVVVRLRRRSLDVLGLLRDVEARYRLPSSTSSTNTPDAAPSEAQNEVAYTAHPTLTLDTLLDAFPAAEETLGAWVEAVDGVLQVRGRAERRRGSAGEEDGEGEELPEWAREEGFEDGLARAHALLLSHAPLLPAPFPSLLSSTPSSSLSSPALLALLRNGDCLCHAYTAVLRHSSGRAFGFLRAERVHGLPVPVPGEGEDGQGEGEAGGEAMSREASSGAEGKKVGGTFRRIENLRMWAAALKFRYALPLVLPPSSTSSTTAAPSLPTSPDPSTSSASSSSLAADSTQIGFDPRLIATRGEGWDTMLARAVGAWAEAVGRERREEVRAGV